MNSSSQKCFMQVCLTLKQPSEVSRTWPVLEATDGHGQRHGEQLPTFPILATCTLIVNRQSCSIMAWD